jgi:predicted ATP-grasp superfamily ATP-dependent carboligase
MARAGVDALVQERIPGDETRLFSLYAYCDRRGRSLGHVVIRKERQWPPLYGSGSYSVTCRNAHVVEAGLALLRSAGHIGSANLEFKLDPRDGRHKLIEVNPRCGDRVQLAIDAGVDMPFIAYQDALGGRLTTIDDYRVDLKWINLVNDFGAFLFWRRQGKMSFRQWWAAARASRSHAYLSWDDPMPFVLYLGRTAAKAARHRSLSLR